jgi:hypothetical protein
VARIRMTTPAPTPLKMGNIALTWPLGAVMSRAGVETGGVPVGMALSEVGGDAPVELVTGACGAVALRLGATVRPGARVVVGAIVEADAVVAGTLLALADGAVGGLDEGGLLGAGAEVAGTVGIVAGATVGVVVTGARKTARSRRPLAEQARSARATRAMLPPVRTRSPSLAIAPV